MARATSKDGKEYQIGSAKGNDFLSNAKAGSTMIGGDGSTWTKNEDGSTTISKNGTTYTVGGSSTGGSPVGSSGGKVGGSSGGTSGGSYQPSKPKQVGYAPDGSEYQIGSDRGYYFTSSAAAGSTMDGSDGSRWTKNEDGTTTIEKNGVRYTVGSSQPSASEVQAEIERRVQEQLANQQEQLAEEKRRQQEELEARIGQIDLGGYGSFQDYLNGVGYEDYTKATQDAIRAAVDQAVQGYQKQIGDTERDTADAARQAYVAKRMGEKNLDQQLAAGGYAGGMADSQRIAQELNYQNELTDLERQRSETVAELEQAIRNAQLTGDMQTAQELASYLQQVQSQWASYIEQRAALQQQATQNLRSEEVANYWKQQELEANNYWNERKYSADEKSDAYSRAMTLMAAGVMPDASTLAAAGISQSEAESLLGRVKQTESTAQTGGTVQAENAPTAGSGYDNGSLTPDVVRRFQRYLNEYLPEDEKIPEDGMWGPATRAAAGGASADEFARIYYKQNAWSGRDDR